MGEREMTNSAPIPGEERFCFLQRRDFLANRNDGILGSCTKKDKISVATHIMIVLCEFQLIGGVRPFAYPCEPNYPPRDNGRAFDLILHCDSNDLIVALCFEWDGMSLTRHAVNTIRENLVILSRERWKVVQHLNELKAVRQQEINSWNYHG